MTRLFLLRTLKDNNEGFLVINLEEDLLQDDDNAELGIANYHPPLPSNPISIGNVVISYSGNAELRVGGNKVQLFDMGMFYDKISDFDFFCMICQNLQKEETSLLLGDLNLSKYIKTMDAENNRYILYNQEDGTTIDNLQYMLIVEFIRQIHGIEKQVDTPENAMTRKYLIDKERRKQERHKNDDPEPILNPLIVGLVNSGMSPYNYESVLDLPIHAFYESLKGIGKHKNYDNVMQGIYSGCIDAKSISQSEINWSK